VTPIQAICSERLLRQPPASIPSPAPGPLYLVGCAAQDASRELGLCRRAGDGIGATVHAQQARDAANRAAEHAAEVRSSSPGTDDAREAKRLADEASDYATQAAEHVEALVVMARARKMRGTRR
jgi:hypothetical protein